MIGDRAIRYMTGTAVLAVAAIAAIVSYSHVYDLGRTHGQSGTAARLLPLSVDGLILAASLVLLQAARNSQRAPALARFALWAGIGCTVAANLAYGLPYGPVGAILSAWPGVAFVLSAEILLGSLRRSQVQPEPAIDSAPGALPSATLTVPGPTTEAVPERVPMTGSGAPGALPRSPSRGRGVPRVPEQVFAAELEAGTVPGVRAIKRKCMVGQPKAQEIQGRLAALVTTSVSEPCETVEVGG